MSKRREPTLNIMQTNQFEQAESYRVACSCGDDGHDLHAWIEVRTDADIGEIETTFYVTGESPWWRPGWNRWQAAWNLLVHGRIETERTLLLRAETAEAFARALLESTERLTKKVASPLPDL
jgi:hypothetical protein